jgi:putative cardiolipin synthase
VEERERKVLMRFALAVAVVVLTGLSGCATLPPPAERAPSAAIAASGADPLGKVAAESVPAGASSAFRPLPLSAWSMDARLTLARQARTSLDLQYYLLQNDVTGHALLRAVRDAALRGVRVRLLVDDLYTDQSDRMLVELASYPNVEVRLFNPFAFGRPLFLARWAFGLVDFARVNHRMHNKMFIADGAFAIAGGRNIADEYFFSSREGNFVDFDLLVAGAAVPRMAAIFDTYWNSRRVYPLQEFEVGRESAAEQQASFEQRTADAATAYPAPPDEPDLLGFRPLHADIARPPLRLMPGNIDVFADDPEKVSGRAERGDDRTTVTARVGEAMVAAKARVLVGSPYFIPGRLGMDGMRALRARGVKVEVVTNSLASNDEPFASAAYARYRVPMLELGVEVYETDTSQLRNDPLIGAALHGSIGRSHSKLIVIDERVTFVGSMNMDFRSSRENTELGLLVDSPELARIVTGLAERVRSVGSFRLRLSQPEGRLEWVATENGVEKVYDDEPGVDLLTRLKVKLMFPFVSEGLL